MIRAVFKDGVLQPLDPPPVEWLDGRELFVEEMSPFGDEIEPTPEALDQWYRELEALVAKVDPDDIDRMEAAIREADEQM